jgi:hypothetical protein
MRSHSRAMLLVAVASVALTYLVAWIDCGITHLRVSRVLSQRVTIGSLAFPLVEDLSEAQVSAHSTWDLTNSQGFGWPASSASLPSPFTPQAQCTWLDRGIPLAGVVFPIRPTWPGLLANALLYCVALGAVHCGLAALLRHRRRLAHRCIQCAHSLSGSASLHCPECGLTQSSTRPA